MTKGDKIVKSNFIICRKHKKKDKGKKKEKKEAKEKTPKNEKEGKNTKSSKRRKEELLPLEHFGVSPPEEEDYS